MKKGYGVFNKAYEYMFKNDLHDPQSIDHQLLRNMILLDEESREYLYQFPKKVDMKAHELYLFSQQFKCDNDKSTIQKVLDYTSKIVSEYDVEFEDMLFGGTEKEILERGTDWCSDMARVASVILDCLDIPCRMVYLANIDLAYNGHVVIEAFYENKYGIIDPIYGILLYKDGPIDADQCKRNPDYLNNYPKEYKGLYKAIAMCEYDPMNDENNYSISRPNEYYKKLISTDHQNKWFMKEEN